MNIITKKVTLLPAPFVGTILNVHIGEGLLYKIKSIALASGHEHMIVNWGDGTEETYRSGIADVEHRYSTPGDYSIRISDDTGVIGLSVSDESSEYSTVYAPMLTGFYSNAKTLIRIAAHAFDNAVNMKCFDVSESSINAILVAAFKNCRALEGELRFPLVANINGDTANLPFQGCEKINAIRFSASRKEVLLSRAVFKEWETTHLGAANATVLFDL